jgi:hypothetical protein
MAWNFRDLIPRKNALLVPARALLVRSKEKRSLVREAGREPDDLEFALAEIHDGGIG